MGFQSKRKRTSMNSAPSVEDRFSSLILRNLSIYTQKQGLLIEVLGPLMESHQHAYVKLGHGVTFVFRNDTVTRMPAPGDSARVNELGGEGRPFQVALKAVILATGT